MEKKILHNVRSSSRPLDVEILETQVYVATDISEYETVMDNIVIHGYTYTLIIYDKNDYIKEIAEKNKVLEDELLTTQMALCDIYEMIGGLG